jgi:Tfp pilus assembly protein PilE
MSSENNDTKWAPHVGWIITDLVIIIIVMAVVKWSKYPNFVERVNTAAALASLILAILAIIYAFYSNDAVAVSVNRIKKEARKMAENNERFDRSITEVVSGIADVKKNLTELSSSRSVAPAGAPPQHVEVLGIVRYMVQTASWNGLKVLRACAIASVNARPFNLKELCKLDSRMSYDYAYGYLVATSSSGLFAHEADAAGTVFTIRLFNADFIAILDSAINARLPVPPEDRSQKEAELRTIAGFLAV